MRTSTIWLVATVTIAACGTLQSSTPDAGTTVCTPGATIACVGPAGCSGGQACKQDGTGYGLCDCGVADGGGGDADNDSGGGEAGNDAGGDGGIGLPDAGPYTPFGKVFGQSNNEGTGVVATDAVGNILLTGKYFEQINFGGGTLTGPASPNSSIFVAKLDRDGNFVFGTSFVDQNAQTPNWTAGHAIAADTKGGVWVVGQYRGMIDFGSKTKIGSGWPNAPGAFALKLDSTGKYVFARALGSAWGTTATAVAIDGSNNAYVGYESGGPTDYGGGLRNVAPNHLAVAKYDSAGNWVWDKQFPASVGIPNLSAMTIDAQGRLVVVGSYRGSLDFGGGPLPVPQGSSPDLYVAKLDTANGGYVGAKGFGSATFVDYASAVAADPNGGIYVAGGFGDTIDFGLGNMTSSGSYDVFVVKLDNQLQAVWAKKYGDSGSQGPIASVAYSAAGLQVFGQGQGNIDFGGGNLSLGGNSGSDVYRATLGTLSASHVFSARYGAGDVEYAGSLAVDPWGHVLLFGTFSDVVNFGTATLTPNGGIFESSFFLVTYDK